MIYKLKLLHYIITIRNLPWYRYHKSWLLTVGSQFWHLLIMSFDVGVSFFWTTRILSFRNILIQHLLTLNNREHNRTRETHQSQLQKRVNRFSVPRRNTVNWFTGNVAVVRVAFRFARIKPARAFIGTYALSAGWCDFELKSRYFLSRTIYKDGDNCSALIAYVTMYWCAKMNFSLHCNHMIQGYYLIARQSCQYYVDLIKLYTENL